MIDSLAFHSTKLFGNRFKKRVSGGGKIIVLIVDFKHPFCANKHAQQILRLCLIFTGPGHAGLYFIKRRAQED